MKKKNPHAAALGKTGGKAGRGAAKARTSEQARAAAQARWAKRVPKSDVCSESKLKQRKLHLCPYYYN